MILNELLIKFVNLSIVQFGHILITAVVIDKISVFKCPKAKV